MKTIRLPDPFPRGKAAEKLEWGTSAWAADSCLVEWSRLEREWLDVPAPQKPNPRGVMPRLAFPPLAAWLGMAVGLLSAAWYFMD
jgi:hypothetical protein